MCMKQAVLLIHGFGGNPKELEPLHDLLVKKKIPVVSVTLTGHGKGRYSVPVVTEAHWRKDIFTAFDSLQKKYSSVCVVGFSMGGALALQIATERVVSKLVLISPCFHLKYRWKYILPSDWWLAGLKRTIPLLRKIGLRVRKNRGPFRYLAHDYLLLNSIDSFFAVKNKAIVLAGSIHTPILIIHSTKDKVTDFVMSKKVFETIPSLEKKFVRYTHGGHLLLYTKDAEDALGEIERFLLNT